MALGPARMRAVAVALVAGVALLVAIVVAAGGASPQAGPGSRDAGGSAARAGTAVPSNGEVPPVTEVTEAAGSAGRAGSGTPRGDRLPGLARPASPEALDRLPALPPGARVVSRDQSGAGRSTQRTLVATTPDPGPAVLAHYRRTLGRYGLVGSPADAVPGATAVRFARGRDVVVVTTTRRGGTTELVVFAALHPGRTPGRG